MCFLFFPVLFFFHAFESLHLTCVMSGLAWLCVHADEKEASGPGPTLLWGGRDKAPQKTAAGP